MVSPAGVFLGFLWLSSVAGISSVLASLVLEKNILKVTSPESLRGDHDSAIGNFGLPKLAGSVAGILVYPDENTMGCREFEQSFKAKPDAPPTFLLLDRGDCFFAIKAWRAQEAGASAVLVADDSYQERLITRDSLSEASTYIDLNITIPCAFISKKLGDQLKKAANGGEIVNVNLDWPEAVPDEDEDDSVKYELWTTSNYDCGPRCDMLLSFVKNFKGAAQALELGGYTRFTPHYVTWYCPEAFILTRQCRSQCINRGRYCAPDPKQSFSQGYEGKDVVVENLRQLCVFRVANESDVPWIWWDYVTEFQTRCPMKQKKFNKECADAVIESLGLDPEKIETCMGNPEVDSDNPVLKEELDVQGGKRSNGNVITLPTLVINNRQYQGKLETGAVLKDICLILWGIPKPAVRSSNKTSLGLLRNR